MRNFSFPRRSIIWIMIFSCTFVNYMVRVNMSILIIAMVKPAKNETKAVPVCTLAKSPRSIFGFHHEGPRPTSSHDYGERYSWSSQMQGHVLGALFWGIIITSIPGGIVAEKYGAKMVIRISTVGSGLLTLLTPVVAAWNVYALLVTRFLMGLLGGAIYPALHFLISRWVPPDEKSVFVSALLGAALGITVTWPVLGVFVKNFGWKWGFYVNGIIVMIWCCTWEVFVTNSPENHRMISDEEKAYILGSLQGVSETAHKIAPYKRIFTSLPFWAFVIFHFGNLYGLFFLVTSGPKFMSTVLGYDLEDTGIMVSIPYVLRIILGIMFGFVGDFLVKRKIMTKTVIRKVFVTFSHFIPGLCLLALCITGCDSNWAIVLTTLVIGVSGASTITNFQNNQDLSPNYTGTLYGIANCIGCSGGFISPIFVGWMTEKNNGLHEWYIIFAVSSAVFVLSAIFFIVFGSGEIQPWNDIENSDP